MPRLFTALDIPDTVAMHLSLLQGGLNGARWITPENYHLTLCFIGDIDERQADDVADALDRIHPREGFQLRLVGLDAFGGKQPHSIFARVDMTPELIDLQGDLERALYRVGIQGDGRKYTPHVTIARLKGVTASATADWLAMRGGFATQPFYASEFVLYSSRDSVGGGPYRVEELYPFAA